VLAIGEIGLDYHYDFSPRDVQQSVFPKATGNRRRGRQAHRHHSREAWADTMALVGEARRGILHCFTGDPQQAREALALGLHLAFGGVLTFPNAEAVREAARITRRTGCWWRRIVPTWPRFLIVAGATSRRLS